MALTEEQIEILSSALVPLFQYLEAEVIKDVARRIKRTMTYTRTAELQALSMLELGYSPAKIRKEAMKILNADPKFRKEVAHNTMQYKKEIARLVQEIENEAYKQNNMIVAKAGDMAWYSDLAVWKEANKELTDRSFLPRLVKAFQLQTNGELKNITRTTGFKTMAGFEALKNLYRLELDKAMVKLCSGTFNRDAILADVVKSLAHSGLRTIDFSSGYSMQLDTAVRVAMRTGFNQMAGKITDENCKRSDVSLVYVSEHWGARDKGLGHQNHKLWQGKVYYINKPEGETFKEECKRIGQSTIEDLWEVTGYSADGSHESDPLGLHGYNCRHQHHPWFEGFSSLPHKNIAEPGPFNINGREYTYYDVTQKMRAMERDIRALKREKEAKKALNEDFTDVSAKLLEKTRKYHSFCKSVNVNPQDNRLRVESGSSDLTKTEAWKEFHRETYLKNNFPKGFQDQRTIGEPISAEEVNNFVEYANSKNVQIGIDGDNGHFDTYRGRPDVLYAIVDRIQEQVEHWPTPIKPKTIILKYDNVLGYNDDRSKIDIAAFAMTKGHTITLNKFMFDDTDYMLEHYEKEAREGYYVKNTSYLNLVNHEMGHILSRNKKFHGKIMRILSEDADLKGMSIDTYLAKYISGYAAVRDNLGNLTEVTSEVLSLLKTDPNNYIIELLRKGGASL